MNNFRSFDSARRLWLRQAVGLAGLSAGLGLAGGHDSANAATASKRILVVLELSGGNDGLNTLVPYTDDAYYRHRPKIGIRPDKLRKIDQQYGFNPGMAGFERLFKDGQVAVVHGCGYAQPSFSHFTSMAYWHTAAPNSGEEFGWIGRLADALHPTAVSNSIINIDEAQSLAVRARKQVPVVFDDPDRFTRKGFFQTRPLFDAAQVNNSPNASKSVISPNASTDASATTDPSATTNSSQRYLQDIARSARESSQVVRDAWRQYKTPVDYGIVPLDLPKIAALIGAGLPTQLYYTAYRHNAFDTHVQQADLHQRLLSYVSDSVSGFMKDMQRLGRADDVTVLVFSEFGRRVSENTSLGTDHGTANHMYLIGKPVKGGHYGQPPDLSKLDAGQNMAHTTDFRRVYASVIEGWFGLAKSANVLSASFEALPLFAAAARA